jgi:hypothetical protein
MFHWICPECGREIPPAVRECPACDPASVAQAAAPEPAPPAAEFESLAAPPVETPRETLPEPGLEVEPLDAAAHLAAAPLDAASPESEPTPLPEPEPVAAVEQEPLAAVEEEPLAAVSTESELLAEVSPEPAPLLDPEPVAAVSPEHAPLPEPEPVAAVAPEPPPLPETQPVAAVSPEPMALPEPLLRLAQQLRDAHRDSGLVAATTSAAAPAPCLEPASSCQPEPVALGTNPPALYPPMMLLLASAPTAVALLAPPEPELAPEPELQWKPESKWEPELDLKPGPAEESEPVGPAAAGRVPTSDLSPLASAPPAPPLVPLPAEVVASPSAPPVSRFSPSALVAGAPALALAPLQDSSTLARRIRPAIPPPHILRTDSGPRITLPGPALPAALNSLQDAGLSRILVDRPKPAKGSRGWLVGVLVAAVPLAGLLGVALYNAPRTAAEPKPAPTSEATFPNDAKPELKSAPVPSVSPAASYSLNKAIEVTGFRFVSDKKPEVRYLVVNHSAAELGAVTVYVTLRNSAAKQGQPPLYRFSFRAPALGPFESKEMSAAVDKQTDKPPHSAGDWQSLHADIELGQ